MNFDTLLEKLRYMENGPLAIDEKAVLNDPYDSHSYGDQVKGREKIKQIPGGVLGNPNDAEHPFRGRLVGSDESVEDSRSPIDEDYINQLAREFSEFLNSREPVEEIEKYGDDSVLGLNPKEEPTVAPAQRAGAVAENTNRKRRPLK